MVKTSFSKIITLAALPVLAILLWNCEKDDICDPLTPVTSRLIVEFYDANNQDDLKNVNNLAVVAQNVAQADTLIFNNVSKIQLPMNTDANEVVYNMILNYRNGNPLIVYSDTMQFNYTRRTEYVSRACGYKTIFDLNNDISLPRPFIMNNNPIFSPGNWVKNMEVEEYNISNETETHVKIYF